MPRLHLVMILMTELAQSMLRMDLAVTDDMARMVMDLAPTDFYFCRQAQGTPSPDAMNRLTIAKRNIKNLLRRPRAHKKKRKTTVSRAR